MKKSVIKVALIGLMILMLTGCGKSEIKDVAASTVSETQISPEEQTITSTVPEPTVEAETT